jgi:hypothetical protein
MGWIMARQVAERAGRVVFSNPRRSAAVIPRAFDFRRRVLPSLVWFAAAGICLVMLLGRSRIEYVPWDGEAAREASAGSGIGEPVVGLVAPTGPVIVQPRADLQAPTSEDRCGGGIEALPGGENDTIVDPCDPVVAEWTQAAHRRQKVAP